MQALGDYVSNMVSDYFNTEYLRQKVIKPGMQVQASWQDPWPLGLDAVSNEKTESRTDEIKVPRFKLRQQNFVSQIEIDKNTRFYMTRLRVSTAGAETVHRFDEFNRHLADFPFAKGR